MDKEQVETIKKHLYVVFKHECEKVVLNDVKPWVPPVHKEIPHVAYSSDHFGYAIGEEEKYKLPLPVYNASNWNDRAKQWQLAPIPSEFVTSIEVKYPYFQFGPAVSC
jgi:hypothetical protein